jgi:hypothetical protein
MPWISLHLFTAYSNLVKARFMPACIAMIALPAGNLCARRFIKLPCKTLFALEPTDRRSADHD